MATTVTKSFAHDPWTLTINAQIHATLSLMHTTPGVTASQQSEARSIAGDVRSLLTRSTGMNLDAFRAVARGIDTARRGRQTLPGHLPQAESSRRWFDQQGINLRERLDAKREERHFQRRRRVANRIEQCCSGIEMIHRAAAKAVECILDPAKRLLQIVGKFSLPKLVPMVAELVIKALKAAREVLLDHNDAVETCLDEIADNISDAAQEKPEAPVHYGCDCNCADHASRPRPSGVGSSTAPPPTPKPAPVPSTAGEEAVSGATTPAATVPADASSVSTTAAAAAPPAPPATPATTPAATPTGMDSPRVADRLDASLPQPKPSASRTGRLCRAESNQPGSNQPGSNQPVGTAAQPDLSPKEQPTVSFDYDLEHGDNAGFETVTCTIAETLTPPSVGGGSEPARLLGTPLGRLGAVAVLGGVGFLAHSLLEAAQTHCTCDCCTMPGAPDPAPAPEPEPAPEPPADTPRPSSEPASKPCGEVAPPPPELGKVPEPVPPKEKSAMMHTAAAQQVSHAGGSVHATGSSSAPSTEAPRPAAPQPTAPPPAAPKPGAAWGSKKLGDW